VIDHDIATGVWPGIREHGWATDGDDEHRARFVSTTRKSVLSHTSRLVRTSEPRRLRIRSLGSGKYQPPTVRHRHQMRTKPNTHSKKEFK
jgi:hypothetical protein